MITIDGYQISEIMYEGSHSLIYRGQQTQQQGNSSQEVRPVIFKILKDEYPSPEKIARFFREYEITSKFNLPGVIQVHGLEKYQNTFLMVLEDFGGESLNSQFLVPNSSPLSLDGFLSLAIQIVGVLDQIHQKQLVHKDINPSNLIWNPTSQVLKLIDFGISTELSREIPYYTGLNQLEGTLFYLSPEQTGRMNRAVDYRSDFYSLGVTFYQLLTGRLPFSHQDPLELVHSHLAKSPPPPSEIKKECPIPLSNLILKLMSKNAEDRYQSVAGILEDLRLCQQQWLSHQKISFFPIGEKDFSTQFQIPQKLYGRKKEIQIMLDAFHRVQQGVPEILLISGKSGVGKSKLVFEIHKTVVQKRGYFISGKFDQLQQDVPYAPLIQAFQELVRQILMEGGKDLQSWKEKLTGALGSNAQVIIEVIPEVELILGKQPQFSDLSPPAAEARFHHFFQKFIQVFAHPQHPLVLFLDDLHWIDSASLKWLKEFLTNTNEFPFLIIGTYRNQEILLLKQVFQHIQNIGFFITEIFLQPLKLHHINNLVSESLRESLEKTESLATLIYQKTNGNPFFVNQFFRSLYEEEFLYYNLEESCWKWELEHIQKRDITDNVADFMVGKLQKLPANTQSILMLASSLGNHFDLKKLSMISGKSFLELNQELLKAIEEGFLLPLNDAYKYLFEKEENSSQKIPVYQFLHDRVQQAAYSLITKDQKKKIHLKVGQVLLHYYREKADLQEKIFDIVNHLNLSRELLPSSKQKEELSHLNLLAGEKAKLSVAYEASLSFFLSGIRCLEKNPWKKQYNLTLTLYEYAAESAYLSINFLEAERLLNEIFQNTNHISEQLKAYEILIQVKSSQEKNQEAVQAGLKILNALGFPFPQNVTRIEIEELQKEINSLLKKKKIEELFFLPEMAKSNQLEALKILSKITFPASTWNYDFYTFVAQKMVLWSIQNGNSPFSILGYMDYGVSIGERWGRIEEGYQFGQLSIQLLQKYPKPEVELEIKYMMNTFLRPGREPFQNSLKPLLEVHQTAIEVGFFDIAAAAIYYHNYYSFISGKKLLELEEVMENDLPIFQKLKQISFQRRHQRDWQLILNLRGKTEDPCLLSGEQYDEKKRLPELIEQNLTTSLLQVYLYKLFLNYLFHNYQEAFQYVEKSEPYSKGRGVNQVNLALLFFYSSLLILVLYPQSSSVKQQQILQEVQKKQRQIEQWTKHSPINYLHKLYLIKAEEARVLNQMERAIHNYDESIKLASKHQYLQDEALAYELYAQFWQEQNKQEIAHLYYKKAHHTYLLWGAYAKVAQLEKKHSFLRYHLSSSKTSRADSLKNTNSYPVESNSSLLDLNTLIKSFQTLSGEVVFDKLLEKLMHLMIENAGAQLGILFLKNEEQWAIEAQGNTEMKQALIHRIFIQRPFLELLFPKSIFFYVIKTQKLLVLNHASQEGRFLSDPYIIEKSPQSILCLPILHRGELTGVLYLENRLISGAFSLERVEILELLTSQISISIENALLYSNLEGKVQERTQKLHQALSEQEQQNLNLKQTQAQLVQSEKMASLGIMVAGVAHEINNPLNVIHANTYNLLTLLRDFESVLYQALGEEEKEGKDFFGEKFQNSYEILQHIEMGSGRIQEIVKELRTFSRLGEAEYKRAKVIEGLKSALHLIQSQYQDSVNFVCEFQADPELDCLPAQLNQAFMNILINSSQAILQKQTVAKKEEGAKNTGKQNEAKNGEKQEGTKNGEKCGEVLGTVTIQSFLHLETTLPKLAICFKDTGCGMSQEIQNKMFDPFFTTKKVGEGAGLGLSIVHKIIKKHQGEILVKSYLGRGTQITLLIPLNLPSLASSSSLTKI